jgi:inner membrane protein
MDHQQNSQSFFSRNSHIIKLGFVGIMALLLLIPVAFVKEIIHEREVLKESAQGKISEQWGSSQKFTSPILVIPFKEEDKTPEGKLSYKDRHIFLSAENLSITTTNDTEKRKKGIFSSIVYTTKLAANGAFNLSVLPTTSKNTYDFDNAYLLIGLTDPTTIASKVLLQVSDTTYNAKLGSPFKSTVDNGLFSMVKIDRKKDIQTFKLQLDIRGSNQLDIIPASKNADLSMQANWPSPSFNGKSLPKTRTITNKGFNATWVTNEYNTAIRDTWSDGSLDISQIPSTISVSFLETANDYQKNQRSAKYAFLIISLSFLSFFVFEFFNKAKIHPIQYAMVGFALAIFYVLLIAFTEHIGYNLAYIISASAVIVLILTYSKAIFKNTKAVIGLGGLLVFLYTYIFVLLQLEDYALLAGAIGLFLILTIIMYLSRKVDWYA